MTSQELLASLTALTDTNGVSTDSGYIEWQHELADGVIVECGDADGNTVEVPMSWDDMEQLHRSLTLALMQRKAKAN